MSNYTIDTAGVVGLGVMGFDIAFLYACAGRKTLVYDAAPQAMAALEQRRHQTVERLRKRNRIADAAAENVQRLLVPCKELGDLREAQLITEAVSENGSTKAVVYRALKGVGFAGTLTTNTSSLTRAALLAEAVTGCQPSDAPTVFGTSRWRPASPRVGTGLTTRTPRSRCSSR